jgi:hypothetical protein
VTDACFSPEGSRIATASRAARIWSVQGNEVGQPMPHENSVQSVSFSADGKWILTTSGNVARVWTSADQRLTLELRHDDVITGAAFNPASDWILTASSDGIGRTWDPPICETPAPVWFAGLIEAVGRYRVDPNRYLTQVADEPADLRKALPALQRPGQIARFARWLLADPTSRTISPFSTETVPNYVAQCLADGSPRFAWLAYLASPGDPEVERRLDAEAGSGPAGIAK